MAHLAPEEFAAFVGLDWADAKHDVCLQRIFPPNLKCEKPVKELNLLHKSF